MLACRPASAELRLTYAGLTDLLAEVSEAVVDRLPIPQRRALDAALLRGADDDPAADPRAAAAGLLSVLDVSRRRARFCWRSMTFSGSTSLPVEWWATPRGGAVVRLPC